MQTNSPRRATPRERKACHGLSGGWEGRAHELFSGCGVRPSCRMRPKESETVQDEEILLSPLHYTN
jgi:hypothetical protein